MEQDRASAVLVHQHELARETSDELPSDRQPHRRHDDAGRAARRGRPGPEPVSGRREGHRRRAAARQPETGALPWRLELHRDSAPGLMTIAEHLLSDDLLPVISLLFPGPSPARETRRPGASAVS